MKQRILVNLKLLESYIEDLVLGDVGRFCRDRVHSAISILLISYLLFSKHPGK